MEIICVLFFNIVRLFCDTLGPHFHTLTVALYKKKLFGTVLNQLCTASITSSSSANFWSSECSFVGELKV